MTEAFSPAEVAHAAGVQRLTFHSWLARKYIPDAPAPGIGRSREFTLLEAIRICAMADLNRLGIPVSTAAGYCAHISGDYAAERTVMILGHKSSGRSPVRTMDIVAADQIKDVGKLLDLMPYFAMIDLTAVAARTAQVLNDPLTRHRAELRIESAFVGATGEKVRLAVYDPSAQDPPAEPAPVPKRARPARKRRLEPA
jgi:hypothetical protein